MMPTALELLERKTAQLLDALEDMARQHCHTALPDAAEPLTTDSGAITANAEALELLAEEGRFRVIRGFGRMVVGYWPEHDPERKAQPAHTNEDDVDVAAIVRSDDRRFEIVRRAIVRAAAALDAEKESK
jgi:hypothetical protein